MAVSESDIICPYCKCEHSRFFIMGTTGLINHNGTTRTMACRKCGKDFECEMIVKIKFKTSK